ncbi:hypothetical protein BsWGS_21231 [Bradybaena similaris]
MVTSCVDLFVDTAWSTEAMDRLKAQKAAQTSSSPSQLADQFKYKVAVFYGTRQERRQNRLCEKLKCEFVSTGCLVTDSDPPPPFTCFSIWSEMTFPEAGECLYKRKHAICVESNVNVNDAQAHFAEFQQNRTRGQLLPH